MEKTKLLSRSNLRKNRGTTIGIFLLMIIAAMLTSLALLIAFDVKPTADKEAKRLNAGDGYFIVNTDGGKVTKDYVKSLLENETSRTEFLDCVYYNFTQPLPFGDGSISVTLLFTDKSTFSKDLDRAEIVKEDESITGAYIYLPYQFATTGGVKIGDEYKFELAGSARSYKVRGFINTTYFGCNNLGTYQFVLDDGSYEELVNVGGSANRSILANFELKENVNANAFEIKTVNKFTADHPTGVITSQKIEAALSSKTFMADILIISFLMVSVIILLVTTLMLSNSIKNYIRENMTNLGALRAMGYTSGNIKTSMLLMFGSLAVLGAIIGGIASYALLPVMAGVFEGQAGVPYKAGLNITVLAVTVLFIAVFILLITMLASRRLKKIEVVAALRDGMEDHNFKKNHIALEKSAMPINISLSLKNIFTNLKQNITIFFVTGLLVFVSVIGLLMYENFNRKPMLSILTFETCGGVIGIEKGLSDEAAEFIAGQDEAENVRFLINLFFLYNDEERLMVYITPDMDKFNNKDVVYKGRFPEHDNEMAISGKFASDYGYGIGDEVKLDFGDKSFSYLITGLVQSCNNDGREILMTEEAAGHMTDMSLTPAGIWFDCDNKEESQAILDACTEKYGDKLETTLNFYDVIDGALTTFKSVTTLMLVLMLSISAVVIMLILFLFIKTLLYNKRKDYGIYKAIGYTSRDLILQTAASFMPAIIISVVIFSVLSYFLANPYMQTIMVNFGLMKCTFAIPVPGVIMIGAGLVILAFCFAVFQARKIKNIQAYQMLTEM